jgi:hypothetical protein
MLYCSGLMKGHSDEGGSLKIRPPAFGEGFA